MIDFVAPCGANQVGPPKNWSANQRKIKRFERDQFPNGRYNDTLARMPNASSHVSMNMNYVTEKKLIMRSQNSGLELYKLCYNW